MRHRLLGLEAGRFVAALLVACFHFTTAFQNLKGFSIFDTAFRAGHAGVEYFFVLSGFIIYMVHAPDRGRPRALAPFLTKRWIRIYPSFWLVWSVLLAGLLASSAGGHRDLTPLGVVLDATLLPTDGDTVLQPSWSLRHEIVFYAFFALIIANIRVGMIVMVGWQVAVLVVGIAFGELLPLWLKPFFYIYNVGFGIGMAVAWAASRWQVRFPGLIAIGGCVAFVTLMTVEWWIGRDTPPSQTPLGAVASPLLYEGAAALIIFGATRFEMARDLPGRAVLKVLGGSSYLLYLIHGLVGSLLIRAFGMSVLSRVPNAVVFLAMIVGAVLAAVIIHLWLEKPLLAWLGRVLLQRERRPVVAPLNTASR